MDNPLVTICMPAYNYGAFVEGAVRSAWAQTYPHLELVVVDDGSTDDTWAILERLRVESPFPMHIVQGEHRGVSAAMNLALRHARGEWICVLHADDIALPDRVALQVAAASDQDVLVHTEYRCIDHDGSPTEYDSSVDPPPAVGDALRALLHLRCDVRSMTLMYRRAAFVGYDETLPLEDWQSILRLAAAGRVAHVREQTVLRRVHRTNWGGQLHRQKKSFSFSDIAETVLIEVCPPDVDIERVLLTHSACAIRHALAVGAFAKMADGLRVCWARFPAQRGRLLALVGPGVSSYLWLHQVRDRLPAKAVVRLVRAKALWKARSAQAGS